jgi:3',5'-cyclic AMP phosphodiesterase CpdA
LSSISRIESFGMIRLAHLSDVHVTAPHLPWKWRDWLSKRLTSWVNYAWLGREQRFVFGDQVLFRLMDDLDDRKVDHVVFSGDATALGFESEMDRAACLLRVTDLATKGLAVPGNHDYCTRFAEKSGAFEKYFTPWQQGRRIGEHRYPFAQRVDDIWLVGVNAAVGNRIPWNASGWVGPDQLTRLRQLLAGLEPGPRVLVVHYPVRLSNGQREPKAHGLRDLDALLAVARGGGVSLWLHGHRHHPYHFDATPDVPFPVICAGSATEDGIWSYGEYTIDNGRLDAVRRIYDPLQRRFRDAERFTLALPPLQPAGAAVS